LILTGAEIVIRLLEKQGVEAISGIPGGANLPLYHALARSRIRHILARHEQGAGFIAQGMARSTGKPAVCFATSGPGATNLLTAIADAKLDSVPLIAITGQVSTSLLGTDAFQEVDTYLMTLPITKHNFLVKDAKELLSVIPRAFTIAGSGRKGPVVIDIPKDVQQQEVEVGAFRGPSPYESADEWAGAGKALSWEKGAAQVPAIAEMINLSERPVIYAGGGVTVSAACRNLYRLARQNSIPVALTLMGLGSFPPEDPLYLGMLGMHGAPHTNIVLEESDLLLAFGVRFDDRATGRAAAFCPNARIVHIDIDSAEINKVKQTAVSVAADISTILSALVPLVRSDHRPEWMERIRALKESLPFPMPRADDLLHPMNVVQEVYKAAPTDMIVTTDVGQHQMWVAQLFRFHSPRKFLTSGGLGTMGFGLPAAIGAALSTPGQRVLCVSGDGSIQMNLQELATLAELDLPVTIVIINNGELGMVRQQQELFYEQTFIASKFERRLDFASIARQFGLEGYSVSEPGMLAEALRQAFATPSPSLVDVLVRDTDNVFPIVPPGAANREMIAGYHG
jgi:acetolactate synthase I/II/III large subunit